MNNVDPWAMQEKLMQISAQELPTGPSFNNTSVLYAALILEETSELLESLGKIMLKIPRTEGMLSIGLNVLSAKTQCHLASTNIRKTLESMGSFSHPLSIENAVSIADDSTDIAVVNSGFILASGIDGSACYNEVASSNLSKANPETGIIDKDGSGKWIKGVNFFKPNLEKVINDE
jgi:hypothetical protein